MDVDLFNILVIKLDRLRAISKSKAELKNSLFSHGFCSEGGELSAELKGESFIFFHIQKALQDWAAVNNIKDPFAIN